MNAITEIKALFKGTWTGVKGGYADLKPEAAYAVSGVVRLTKVTLHTVGDITNGAASTVELTSALADGFATEALGGSTQAERISGAEAKGKSAYTSLFGDEEVAVEEPLTPEEQELLKELVTAGVADQAQIDTLSPKGLRAVITLAEEAAAAAAEASGL